MHTDSTPWDEPNGLTILACVRADATGLGATEVCWLPDALVSLESDGGVRVLRAEPAWWPHATGWVAHPVIDADGCVRWHAGVLFERRSEWPSAPSPDWMSAVARLADAIERAHR